MIWLTWRQNRVAGLMGLVVLLALSLLFVLDVNALNAAFQQHHFTQCFNDGYLPCGLMPVPGETWQWRTIAGIVLPWFPLVIGVFIGAPLLAKEYEQRTHMFAWTQSVPATRWLTTRLAVLVGATLLGFGLLACLTTWWGAIQDNVAFSPWDTFTIRGPVPVAYALFSLLLGVMVGAFIRRTIPAMALTFLLLLVMQALLIFGYPYLVPPAKQLDYDEVIRQQHLVGKFGNNPQDLLLRYQYAEPDGRVIDNIRTYCQITPSQNDIDYVQCLVSHNVRMLVTYQRFGERFWPLQLVTTGLLLVLAALVTGLTYWQLRRRLL